MLFFNFIFQGLPETAALILTAFSIVGYNPNLREIIGYSIILVICIYLIRLLPIPFGLHTIVGVIVLVVLVCKVTKVSLGTAFCVAFSTMFLLFFLETVFHLLFKSLIGNVSMTQNWVWIMIGWPQIIGLAGATIIIRKIRPSVIKRWLNVQ